MCLYHDLVTVIPQNSTGYCFDDSHTPQLCFSLQAMWASMQGHYHQTGKSDWECLSKHKGKMDDNEGAFFMRLQLEELINLASVL